MFPILTRVAGVTFENRDGTSRQAFVRRIKPDDELSLCREPGNPFDENAIAVFWPEPDGEPRGLGYVPRALAAVLAPLVDDGIVLTARAVRAVKVPRRGWRTPAVWGVRIAIAADPSTWRPALASGLEPVIAKALAEDEATPDPGYAPALGGSRAAFSASGES